VNDRCGLRLVGLVGQGSIPWAFVGLGTFSLLVATGAVVWTLQGHNRVGERRMPMTNDRPTMFGLYALQVIWGVGTSGVAGALPA